MEQVLLVSGWVTSHTIVCCVFEVQLIRYADADPCVINGEGIGVIVIPEEMLFHACFPLSTDSGLPPASLQDQASTHPASIAAAAILLNRCPLDSVMAFDPVWPYDVA